MIPGKHTFQQAIAPDLIARINALNNIALTQADVLWSTPQVVSGSWREQSTTKNTAIRATVPAGRPDFSGSRDILYDRLSFALLANIRGFEVSASGISDVHGMLPYLKMCTGLMLATTDVENLPLVANQSGGFDAVLTATPANKAWYGSVTVKVKEGGLPLDEVIVNTKLTGLNYPTTDTTQVFAQVYMYGYDFTDQFDFVSELDAGELSDGDALTLSEAIKARDVSDFKASWNASASATEFSLQGATIVSNGLNNESMPTNTNYKYVLVVKLRDQVTSPKGLMYLHYNDPFDPEA